MEHFCTLFDQGFLPQGLALHSSLCRHGKPFTLWILCVDDPTRQILALLKLPHLRLLSLEECETDALRQARANRSHGEYCWTLASHLFSFVFERDPAVRRLTYLDADVFFFGNPGNFLDELERSGKSVLITEHAYAPPWAHYAATAGNFCVQFITFVREPAALALLNQWQQQTRDNCSSARDAASFGDQQYLDVWPANFPMLVHVLEHRGRTLAPWNADHVLRNQSVDQVVLFHFHNLRIIHSRWTQWAIGYPLHEAATLRLYASYQSELMTAFEAIRATRFKYQPRMFRPGFAGYLRLVRSWLLGRLHLHHHISVADL